MRLRLPASSGAGERQLAARGLAVPAGAGSPEHQERSYRLHVLRLRPNALDSAASALTQQGGAGLRSTGGLAQWRGAVSMGCGQESAVRPPAAGPLPPCQVAAARGHWPRSPRLVSVCSGGQPCPHGHRGRPIRSRAATVANTSKPRLPYETVQSGFVYPIRIRIQPESSAPER